MLLLVLIGVSAILPARYARPAMLLSLSALGRRHLRIARDCIQVTGVLGFRKLHAFTKHSRGSMKSILSAS